MVQLETAAFFSLFSDIIDIILIGPVTHEMK